MRGEVFKRVGENQAAHTSAAAVLVQSVQNVLNSPAQAIFSYTCDTSAAPQLPPLPCPLATAADKIPANIRDVIINLIVAAPQPDATSGPQRIVTLTGRGRRVNPNQCDKANP